MNDQVLPSRDDQRAREHSGQIHRLNDERVPDTRKLTWRPLAAAVVVFCLTAWMVTSCFVDQQLHKPKIDRANVGYGHSLSEK